MARRLHGRRLTVPDSSSRPGRSGRHQKACPAGLGAVGYTGLAGIALLVVAATTVVLPRATRDVSTAWSSADTNRTSSRTGTRISSRRLTMPGADYKSGQAATSAQTTTTLASAASSTEGLSGCTGVPVRPGDNVQAKLNANPGATFCFKPGVYRTGGLLVRAGQRLIGQPGATFDGTKLVGNWTKAAGIWVSTGQTFNPKVVVAASGTKRECEARPANCHYADLWVDGRRQQRVLSADRVGPGSWHWDYAADKVYLGTDPQGKTVRLTNQRSAFQGSGYAVKGFTIRRYGETAIIAGQNVTIQGNDIAGNHGLAMKVGTGSRVIANHIRHNGQYGITGSGKGILVEGNEIAFNNNLRFANSNGGYWNAGATKFVYTDGLVFRGNHSHHNYSDGYWTDINNINTLVENNRFEGNERHGVNHEISYAITIRNNTITGNQSAGIWVNSSPNANVYANTLSGNGHGILITDQNRGPGAYGEWTLKNASIHDNKIVATQGTTGALGALRLYAQNNHFERNSYVLDSMTAKRFRWRQNVVAFRQWQTYGNDDNGGTAAVSGA